MLQPNTADPGKRRLRGAPVIERLMFRTVADDEGCWLWLGATNTKGYGHIAGDMGGRVLSVHRVVWAHVHGPIPTGLEIDHLCFVRNCVNPDHLDLVTHAENIARTRQRTHCKQGHEFTPETTYTGPAGNRRCRPCATACMRDWRARQ